MKLFLGCTLMLSAALVACGGGDETVAGIDARGTPVRVGVVSKGTITGFGSIIVNGIRFDTASASIDVDGNAGTQSDLKVGHVVVVRGTMNDDGTDAVADAVSFGDLVEGPISAIDTAAGTITVLGQLVVIDDDTSFDEEISPASIDGLNVNDTVEVSGFFLADGSISATRIERKTAGSEFEVTGHVSNLTATTFQINDLTVDFSAAQLDDFPAGSPENGQRVEAKGNNLGGSGELLATRVKFKGDELEADDGPAGDTISRAELAEIRIDMDRFDRQMARVAERMNDVDQRMENQSQRYRQPRDFDGGGTTGIPPGGSDPLLPPPSESRKGKTLAWMPLPMFSLQSLWVMPTSPLRTSMPSSQPCTSLREMSVPVGAPSDIATLGELK